MAGEKKNLTHEEIHALRGKYKLVPTTSHLPNGWQI
jgi:hypothetical protein